MRCGLTLSARSSAPDRKSGSTKAWARSRLNPLSLGDVVLARKDTPASYHLAVTVDDAIQGVTLVTRARDLFPATHIHRLLQALLDLPVPRWHHHTLLTDATGKRFAKRDRAKTLPEMRAAGTTPEQVRAREREFKASPCRRPGARSC